MSTAATTEPASLEFGDVEEGTQSASKAIVVTAGNCKKSGGVDQSGKPIIVNCPYEMSTQPTLTGSEFKNTTLTIARAGDIEPCKTETQLGNTTYRKLAAGEKCTLRIAFAPQGTGQKTGNVVVGQETRNKTDAEPGDTSPGPTVQLSGNGAAKPTQKSGGGSGSGAGTPPPAAGGGAAGAAAPKKCKKKPKKKCKKKPKK